MAPDAYIKARTNLDEVKVTVDGKPYLPFLSADAQDDDSIRKVVVHVLEIEETIDANYDLLEVRHVAEGNTNKLFHVSGPLFPDGHGSVLVRIFGGEGLIDRDIETSTYAALAQQGIALKYYGRFANGRCEEWCHDKLALKTSMDMQAVSPLVAQSLAHLHAHFQIPPHLQPYHDPKKTPTLWTQLKDWLHQALKAKFQTPHDTAIARELHLEKLTQEVQWLQTTVCSPESKVGFCHNDVLADNILANATKSQIQLIDFEYGGMNYLSYDIANHFNEYAGGTDPNGPGIPDYTKFPSLEVQRDFCMEYLTTIANGTKPTTAMVDDLLHEIKGFVLANHLVWGLWGINQAATEGCGGLNYMTYGSCRIRRYFADKETWE